MSGTKTHQRVFLFVTAMLFLATAIAGSVLVVWQISQENKASKITANTTNNTSKEGKLEGTKLADFTPVAKIDSLQKIDSKPGTGEEVKAGATVTAHYTGAVASTGVIFQSSHDSGQPIPFSLNGVIKGWTDGVPGMKVGGTRRLLIPADLAYGANPPAGSGIPANADLVFDVEVVSAQ